MYTTREHGTGHVFCVPPSFVLIHNKYIRSKYYKEQIACWTKATKNWEWNSGVYIFRVLFLYSRLCNQRRDNLELLPFIFGGQKRKKKKRKKRKLKCGLCEHHLKCQNNHLHYCGHPRKEEEEARLARDRQRRYRSWLVNLGDQVERWRERCTRLDDCDRKLAKLLLDK